MIIRPLGLDPLPTNCEAGVAVVHEHVPALIWPGPTRVALCISHEEESGLDRTIGPGVKGYCTDLGTARTYQIIGGTSGEDRWQERLAIPVCFDSLRVN